MRHRYGTDNIHIRKNVICARLLLNGIDDFHMVVEVIDRIEELSADPPEGNYVVIDVFRFSTTAIYMIHSGVKEIHPFQDIKDALKFKASKEDVTLFGEHNGEVPTGFDHNNSPSNVRSMHLKDAITGIRTTNGTRAIEAVGDKQCVLIGSIVNAHAISSTLSELEGDHYLLAVGRSGDVAIEDKVCAEMIKEYLNGELTEIQIQQYIDDLSECDGANTLRARNQEDDLELALEVNALDTVPEVDDGVIKPHCGSS